MTWVATAIVGGAAISAIGGAYAADKASDAAKKGTDQAIAEQRRQFDVVMGLQQPYAVTGTGALNQIAKLYGLPSQPYQAPAGFGPRGATGGAPLKARTIVAMMRRGMSIEDILKVGTLAPGKYNKRLKYLLNAGLNTEQIRQLQTGVLNAPSAEEVAAGGVTTPTGPDLSVFTESPDYRFRQQEGTAAIDRSAAARGGALSGNAVRAQTEFASDLASTEFGNFFNRLATIAGIGQTAVNTASNAASATGSNVSNLLVQGGNARASGILGTANSIGGALNSGLNNYLLLRGGYFGSTPSAAPTSNGGGAYYRGPGGSN